MALPVGILVAVYLTEFARPARSSYGRARAGRLERRARDRGRHLRLRIVRAGHGRSAYAGIVRAGLPHASAGRASSRRSCSPRAELTPGGGARAVGAAHGARRSASSSDRRRRDRHRATLATARVAGETAPLLFTSSLVGTRSTASPTDALQLDPCVRSSRPPSSGSDPSGSRPRMGRPHSSSSRLFSSPVLTGAGRRAKPQPHEANRRRWREPLASIPRRPTSSRP